MRSTRHTRGPSTAQKDEAVKGSRSAFETAVLGFGSIPRWLNFNTPPVTDPPTPKPDDAIEKRFAEMQAKIDAADSKANAAHAELRKFKEEKKPPIDDDKDKDKPPAPKTPAEKELSDRLAKIEKSRETTAKNAKRNALKSSLAEMGITGDSQEDAIDLFMQRNGDRLTYNEETDKVLFKHSEIEDPKPLSEHLAAEAKAGKFTRFKAPKTTPTAGPTPGAGGGASGDGTTMTLAEFTAAQRAGTKLDLEKIRLQD